MTTKRLLVIGAGLAQVDAIKRAKEMGHYILATDGSNFAPGLKIAHEFKIIDVTDIKATLAYARERKIDGVISYASEITLKTVLVIREEMKLPGLDRSPLEISLNKSKQREIFLKAQVAQPKSSTISEEKQLDYALDKIGLPLVIKPVDNSGSRGVAMISQKSELIEAFNAAKLNSLTGCVILEEYMEGTELTIEGISFNGKHHILAISDKYKPENANRVATQLAFPANISSEDKKLVTNLIQEAYHAAGVDNTPTHSEIILTNDGPKIVEIGLRGGGFYVFTRMVEAVSGYDIITNWTRISLGESPEIPKTQERGTVLRFWAATPGILIEVQGLEKALNQSNVLSGGMFIMPGEEVPELKTDGSRTGWCITTGATRNEAVALANKVEASINFIVNPVHSS